MMARDADDIFGDDFDGEDATVVDRLALSALLGFTPKEIDKLVREGMPPHGGRHQGRALRFSVPECVQFLLERAGTPIEAAKRRREEATARKREAEAGRLENRLVDIELVESVIKDQTAKLQSELLSVPARVPKDVRELVRKEITAVVNRFAVEVPAP